MNVDHLSRGISWRGGLRVGKGRFTLPLLLLLGLCACGASEQPTASSAPTGSSTPAGTSQTVSSVPASASSDPVRSNDAPQSITAVPPTALSANSPTSPSTHPVRDLTPLLMQPGDLPAGVSAVATDNPAPLDFLNDPPASAIFGQRFMLNGRSAGSISVLLYESPAHKDQAYTRLIASVSDNWSGEGHGVQPQSGVGDRAATTQLMLASSTYGPSQIGVVIFARCQAVTIIRLNERASSVSDTIAYAKRLDARLMPVVCAPHPTTATG